MLKSSRTAKDAREAFQTCKSSDPKDRVEFYDSWADNYETDSESVKYRAPHEAMNSLAQHFCGNPEEVLVLDVACGSGWVAKLMVELGFRHFVGVDGSKGMLEQAAKTGLYQDLKLAVLGPEPLPAQSGMFDVVILTGALDDGFCPVSIVRELHQAAKPGGLIVMARGDHTRELSDNYKKELEAELQLMEDQGLWGPGHVRKVERYMSNPHVNVSDHQEEPFICGTVYVYRKSTQSAACDVTPQSDQ